jgi:hypothetical protein
MTGLSVQYGCETVTNKTSYTVTLYPSDYGISGAGDTIDINAQAFSPCSGGANYISGDAYISQCKN